MNAMKSCAARLERSILRGHPAAGERLPPERDLAASFGVGRATVRGALGQLAARGLLEVRQGSGYAVRDFRRSGGLELLPELAAQADTDGELAIVAELLRVRRHLAAAVVERLSSLPSPDLAPVHAALDAFEMETAGDWERLAAADLEVVAALLEASESLPLQLCFNPVLRVLLSMPRLQRAIYADPASNLTGYRALLAAIAAGPVAPDAVVALMAARDRRTLATLASTTS